MSTETRQALSILADAMSTASAALAQAVERIEELAEPDPQAYWDYLPPFDAGELDGVSADAASPVPAMQDAAGLDGAA